jgi:hypothetical protein
MAAGADQQTTPISTLPALQASSAGLNPGHSFRQKNPAASTQQHSGRQQNLSTVSVSLGWRTTVADCLR